MYKNPGDGRRGGRGAGARERDRRRVAKMEEAETGETGRVWASQMDGESE